MTCIYTGVPAETRECAQKWTAGLVDFVPVEHSVSQLGTAEAKDEQRVWRFGFGGSDDESGSDCSEDDNDLDEEDSESDLLDDDDGAFRDLVIFAELEPENFVRLFPGLAEDEDFASRLPRENRLRTRVTEMKIARAKAAFQKECSDIGQAVDRLMIQRRAAFHQSMWSLRKETAERGNASLLTLLDDGLFQNVLDLAA